MEKKKLSSSGLAAISALTAVEKIPDISSLVKKQIIRRKLLKFKRNLLIIMRNTLLLHNLISLQHKI